MSNFKTLDGNNEVFKTGYLIGMAAALDSLGALQKGRMSPGVDPHEAMALAVVELGEWLWGDDLPSEVKTDVIDELPPITLSQTAEQEIPLPPGVDRLRGVTYSDNKITDEMADNRDAFLSQTDEGDDSWRGRMDPRTRVDE